MGTLSEWFDWEEANVTQHREINNEIPIELYPVIKNTALNADRVRNLLGVPMLVTSWYRSPALNTAVGSNNNTSEHPLGRAIDFYAPRFGSPVQVVKWILKNGDMVGFNQLILEHGWIHISFPVPPAVPKNQVLTLLYNGKYASGITDKYGNPI
jgi:zinc D-Ala-D-Ala carboxypeptidase